MNNKSLIPLVIVVTLTIGFLAGQSYKQQGNVQPLFGRLINQSSAKQPENVNFDLFWQTWETLNSKFVDKEKLDPQQLVYGAIEGMVAKAGDPYTVFFTPKEAESFAQEVNGAFAGIGIEIGTKDGFPVVVSPIKGTPAFRAGFKAGDLIIKIGDKSTKDMKLNEAVNLIRGKQGTQVSLTYTRDGFEKPAEVLLTREVIKIPSVEWKMIDGNIAHLQIFSFNRNIGAEFQRVAEEIRKSEAKSIILDLRGNPGGLLDASIYVADFFLSPLQTVVIEKFGDGRQQEYRTQGNGLLMNYPTVILLNQGSASASEILAGALHDNRNIKIIGEKSFGKGSVQEVVELGQGSSLKVTIAKWLTPNGTSINDNGISPDIEVKITPEDIKKFEDLKNNQTKDQLKDRQLEYDPQLDKARQILKN